jgi:FkbM family methyltransferase
MLRLARFISVIEGAVNYGNPLQILLQRIFMRCGVMTIVDRQTGVSVKAMRHSYPMFGETWYQRDYDVAGCPLRKDDLVVDIGANQGFFTCYAAQRGARVYAFEPNPRAYELLRKNISSNGFEDRVHADGVAVSDFEGEAELTCSSFRDGGANTIHPQRAERVASEVGQNGRVRVKVARLSSLIPANRGFRLLKLDCEGSELAILRDLKAPGLFDSIAVEYHEHAYPIESLIECLLGFGMYQVYMLRGHIIHAVRTDVLLAYAKSLG